MESDQTFDFVQGVASISIAIFLLARIRHFPEEKDLLFLASGGFTLFAATILFENFTNLLSPELAPALTGIAAAIIFICIMVSRSRQKKAQSIGDSDAATPLGDERAL